MTCLTLIESVDHGSVVILIAAADDGRMVDIPFERRAFADFLDGWHSAGRPAEIEYDGCAVRFDGRDDATKSTEGEMTTYCAPLNAGLQSDTKAVCRRLGRLLDALAVEINDNIVTGAINADLRDARAEIMRKLRTEGWTMGYAGGDRLKVRPPGHKQPFGFQTGGD